MPFSGWTADVDRFQTTATNFFDHNPVGNSNVFFPVTIDGALIKGTEVTLRSPRTWALGQFHLAYAYQTAAGPRVDQRRTHGFLVGRRLLSAGPRPAEHVQRRVRRSTATRRVRGDERLLRFRVHR